MPDCRNNSGKFSVNGVPINWMIRGFYCRINLLHFTYQTFYFIQLKINPEDSHFLFIELPQSKTNKEIINTL